MAEAQELGWNAAIIRDFHDHGGEITLGRLAGSRMLLMTTIGAHTGEKHTVPLGYDPDGDDYIVVGSNSGLEQHPAWLANIAANPVVTIEVGTESFPARAVPTSGAERRRLLDARIARVPIFGDYERKAAAARELAVVRITRINE
jgi:deazaflavin-dependent oxidoreductase (nitroreductase family)